MPRKVSSQDDRAREAGQVRAAFERLKNQRKNLTQESLSNDLSVTQGLVFQWLSGKTRIPDIQLLRLGKELRFNPFSVRPSLREYAEFFQGDGLLEGLSEEDKQRMKAAISAFKESVDTTKKVDS